MQLLNLRHATYANLSFPEKSMSQITCIFSLFPYQERAMQLPCDLKSALCSSSHEACNLC